MRFAQTFSWAKANNVRWVDKKEERGRFGRKWVELTVDAEPSRELRDRILHETSAFIEGYYAAKGE